MDAPSRIRPVCRRGGPGASVGTPEGIRNVPSPRLDLRLVDTNGAGDALAVGFLASYVLEGCSLTESVDRGQVAARWNPAQRACSGTLVTAEQLDDLVHQAAAAKPS